MLLPKAGLVVMTSGNVSGRDPETNLVVIKPSGYSYEKLSPQHMVVVDLDGNIVEGNLGPSTDTETHLYVYRNRPDVFGVCHTHSKFASVFAALGEPIPACLTASTMLGGEIPLGDYVPIGGEAIGEEIVNKIADKMAIIMQNHGVFTIGCSATEAIKMAIEVEAIAEIMHHAKIRGTPIPLDENAINETRYLYKNLYGQHAE